MKNKLFVLIVMAIFIMVFAVMPAKADPVASLNVLDSNIVVGETFDVEVWIDGGGIDAYLLAFGFNIDPSSTLTNITYNNDYTINPGFDTDISSDTYIGGSAFPGITDNNVLLATLSFNALSAGTVRFEILGLFDQFDGLYFLDDDFNEYNFDINASKDIIINPSGTPVPEPATMLFLGCGIAGIGIFRKNFRKAHHASKLIE
jgi:hypothetical protein